MLLGSKVGSLLGVTLGNALVLGIELGRDDRLAVGIEDGLLDGEMHPGTITSPSNVFTTKFKFVTLTFISVESGS